MNEPKVKKKDGASLTAQTEDTPAVHTVPEIEDVNIPTQIQNPEGDRPSPQPIGIGNEPMVVETLEGS